MARNYDAYDAYNAYEELKTCSVSKVNEQNANDILEKSKHQLLNQLKTLDVKNITQIEKLYLIVAPMTQAISIIAAQKIAKEKNISFEEAQNKIGTDEITQNLKEIFMKELGIDDFSKFIAIDNTHKPAKQAWAGLHARMCFVANVLTTELRTLHNNYNEALNTFETTLKEHTKNNETKLFAKGEDLLKQVKTIAGDHPEKLPYHDLNDLTKVLICANNTLKDRNDPERSKQHADKLANLSENILKKSSTNWRALGVSLLKFVCAALVIVGALATIPWGNSRVLASIMNQATVVNEGLSKATAAVHHQEKTLAKSVEQFKTELSDIQPTKPDNTNDNQHKP